MTKLSSSKPPDEQVRPMAYSCSAFRAVLHIGGEPVITESSGDVTYVKESMPDGVYKIKPLREIVNSGNLRPQFGDMRVFVFNDFNSMSEICQNALLKFIEEPQEYNRFVMTADSTAKILPTILSRVVVIRGVEAPNESNESAKAIISALKRKSEYEVAAEFNKIKDRQALGQVLKSLLEELSVLMQSSKNPAMLIRMTDVVQKYIKRAEVNPNIPMTAASCTADLYKEIFS